MWWEFGFSCFVPSLVLRLLRAAILVQGHIQFMRHLAAARHGPQTRVKLQFLLFKGLITISAVFGFIAWQFL
jgi:hypothetical protein